MKKKARQSEFKFVNLGGKRRGAGRKPKGARAGVSHAARPKLKARYPVLVTMRLVAGLPSLRANDTHELIQQAVLESTREDDVYSSGPAFDGWREKGAVSDRRLERARTWLLSVGWRRLGLIDLLELPKGAATPLPARASA